MLFISRYVGAGMYGLVDTDDGCEEIVTKITIENAKKSGVVIHGAEDIANVMVYQPESTRTMLQIKTITLSHIDVKTYKNKITSVNILSGIKKPVIIRLSDFGTVCADYILIANKPATRLKVLMVLDDKVGFGKGTFWTAPSLTLRQMGIALDIHELSDDTAIVVYKGLYFKLNKQCFEGIVDTDDRFKYMTELVARQ